jgi:hypothetical protein
MLFSLFKYFRQSGILFTGKKENKIVATIITIVVLVGALLVLSILLLAFAYPAMLMHAARFIFVKPFKALARGGHKAPVTVKAGAVKTDIPQPK